MNKNNLQLLDNIICISLVIFLLYKTYISYNSIVNVDSVDNVVNRFSDIPNTTSSLNVLSNVLSTTPITTNLTSMPTATTPQCNGGTNLITYCMNYNGCCSQSNIGNNSCFCNHPFVINCKNEYDNCTGNDCQAELKKCCVSYNNIDIDSNNFKKPIKQEQKSKTICSINSINMEQKCMELCQTNTNCKSYSIDNINCMLFSDIDPLQNNSNYKTKTDYFIKKSN
jgi:hypothetical protein